MLKLHLLRQIWKHLGIDWVAFRLRYAARLRSGALQRQLPETTWEQQPLSGLLRRGSAVGDRYTDYRRDHSPAFFFKSQDQSQFRALFSRWDSRDSLAVTQAEEAAAGWLRLFGGLSVQVGSPPAWHRNPITGQQAERILHWSQIGDFDRGDIRIIWELSRFGFAFALVRAYWRTSNEKYAELFWDAFEDWREQNPPQTGANWKCGQEASIRAMAWCFALYGFNNASVTTADRIEMLVQMVGVSGMRIEANFDYSQSQRNNHGITEAAALYTIGLLFPELKRAEKWKRLGRNSLEAQARDLIYDDGTFSQHSVNYHRLMLHDYLWVLRLADIHDEPFSEELRSRVSRAGEFLYQIQDDSSGRVPRCGQDDSSLILPLDDCPIDDFRSVIQAVCYCTRGERKFESGPWDETLMWLFGTDALEAPLAGKSREDLRADCGGYYTIRSSNGFAFVRCGSFVHRPSQADLLHVDLWWRGLNVATDPGTYSYNAPDPWNNELARTAYHNTVVVDDCDQMERPTRFLWLPWPEARVLASKRDADGRIAYWEGEHDGYRRLKSPVNHRRAILRIDESWLIADSLTSSDRHLYRLHWLLPDLEFEWNEQARKLELETEFGKYYVCLFNPNGAAESSLMRADRNSARGWVAPRYCDRAPALSLALQTSGTRCLLFSLFSPQSCNVRMEPARGVVESETFALQFRNEIEKPGHLLADIVVNGANVVW